MGLLDLNAITPPPGATRSTVVTARVLHPHVIALLMTSTICYRNAVSATSLVQYTETVHCGTDVHILVSMGRGAFGSIIRQRIDRLTMCLPFFRPTQQLECPDARGY